ncbi:galactose metabolism-related protein [Trifolium repens]|nr:SNF1-related protein kinase regulatory subunit beta-2 [Trifolium repens]WJX59204.1 galactose metabolism-related protein [Trifolium repens]
MGNANGREDGAISDGVDPTGREPHAPDSRPPVRAFSSDSMANSPPQSPRRSRSPILFGPQVPLAPLQRGNGPPFLNQMWQNESHGIVNQAPEQGIPVMITWNYGGNSVAVEGSWDNWTSRKALQRGGKDHSILIVLPSGIFHYRFIVDGEQRYIPDLPYVADEMGNVCNLLDVNDYVPENPEGVSEFEAPASPESSYGQAYPAEEDFAKEPMAVPSQLHLTVLGMENADTGPSSKPQHVVLNHVFIEKNMASKSVVALGLTHRFQSKYVTVVLYKPLRR